MEAAALGLRVDGVEGIDRATSSLDRLTDSAQKTERASDQLAGRTQASSRSLAEVARQSDSASRGISNLARVARSASALIVTAIGGMSFGRVISETARFEDALLGLKAVSGATAGQMEALEKQARTLGATSMFSAQQAGDAQRFLAQAGFEVNEILSATPGLLDLATAGQLDLARAADIASNVLGGMGMEVAELGRVNDVLAATAAGANTSIEQLGQALSYAAPFAAAAGISIEDTAAAIGAMSDAGIQASRAGTGLVGIIRQLSRITPAAARAIEAAGIAVEDLNIEANGLHSVLDTLSRAGLDTGQAIEIFGSEAGAAALNVIRASDGVAEFSRRLDNADGAAKEMAQTIGSGLTGSMRSFTSMLSELVISLGRDHGVAGGFQAVIDTASGVLAVYNGMLSEFAEANNLTDEQARKLNTLANVLGAVTTVAGSAAAAIVVYQGTLVAATAAQALFNAAVTANPLGLIVTAAGAAVGALYYYREELGLVDVAAQNATNAIAANAGAIRAGSQAALDSSYETLVNSLEAVSLQAQEAMAQLVELEARQRFYENSHKGVADSVTGAISQQNAVLAELWERQVNLQRAMRDNRAERERLTGAEGDAVDTGEILVHVTSDLTTETARAARATDDLADNYQSLRDRLRPLEASQRKYAQEKATLVAWAMRENMATSELQGLLRDLERDYRNAGDAAEVYGFTGKKVLEDSAYDFRTWEEVATSTISRVDNAGQDLWLGFIDGSRNALDTVKRFFQQTLAEIAHMLVTRRLTVAVAGSLGLGGSGAAMAGDGFGGGGFGGMGSMLSTGRNVWNAAQQGFGNIAWTGVPTSYTGGWAGSATAGMGTTGGSSFLGGSMGNYQGMQGLAGAGAGLAGGWAGNKVFGDSEHGGTLATIGGTIGAYWGPIGAAVGSFIGSGLGKLIGGSQTSPELNLRTVATGTMPSGGTGWEHHGKAYTSGVFGDIGFADRGTSRLRKQFPDGEHEFLEAIAGMDAMMASLAQSEEQFKAMESAARSWSARAGGPQGIVDQLSDRTATILGALDGEFGKFVRSLDGGLEEVVAQALIAREALTLLSASQERLGFRFNEAAKGAYESAFAIAELAGGLDNLAAMQEAYYQAYFSEAERAAHLQEDLTQALSELGLQLPETRDGFRALVEAQDLNSEAGQRNYVALLQLAGGFDQLQQALGEVEYTADRLRDTWGAFQRDSLRMQQELLTLAGDSASVLALARGQELAAMDESLRPFQERLWALQDEAEALNNYHRELERVGTQLGSALDQIQGFVDQRRGALGTPAQNLEELERQWREQLSLAQSGDMSALRSITQYADRLMQAGQEYFASGEGFQDIQEQVLSALEGLDNLTAEEFLADEIRDAIEGLDVDKIAQTALDELAALQNLHDTTQNQVSLLADINQSVISVRDALEGMGAVPSFASGGYHSGGLRLVGERGPELEVTGPSRIYDAATTRSMLSPAPLLGGSDTARLLRELKRELAATREENRQLLERVGDNTGATVGAVMQGNETSARQRSEQIREQRAANRAARITKGGRVT